jgi:hypothetical protein
MNKSRKRVRNTNSKYKKKNKKQRTRKIKHGLRTLGGRAVDAGGYGCIFNPQLESYNCSGNTSVNNDKQNYISKLMVKSDAEEEYNNSKKINEIIRRSDESIFRYVLTNDTSICEVRMMNKDDLDGYSSHCKKLKNMGFDFNESNLSSITPERLGKLRTVNSPNGGTNLYTIFNFLRETPSLELNRKFCVNYSMRIRDVYQNAIYKLYNLSPKIIHGDMKEENMICKFSKEPMAISGTIKVIDWGLSYIYDPNSQRNSGINLLDAINQLSRRPYQFNLPFTILFYDLRFQQEYKLRVLSILNSSSHSSVKQQQIIDEFCNSYFNNQYFYENKRGERKYILDDFNKSIFLVVKRVFPDIRMSLEDYVRKYLATALNKYTYANRRQSSPFLFGENIAKTETPGEVIFHSELFSSEIYLPMIDSYGFFLTYGSLLSYFLFKTTSNSNSLSHIYQSFDSTKHGGDNKNNVKLSAICNFIAIKIISQCLIFDPTITGEEYRTNTLNATREIHNKILTLT